MGFKGAGIGLLEVVVLCVSGLLRCHLILSLLHSGSRGIAVFGFKVIVGSALVFGF